MRKALYSLGLCFIFCVTLSYTPMQAQNNQLNKNPEYKSVYKAMLNYVEALYEVDTMRIIESVDPSLRKIGYWFNPSDKKYRDNLNMSYDQLKSLTARWNADGNSANEESIKEVVIFEVNDRTASGKVEAVWGVDYMHLAKLDGTWKIMNIVWQSRPEREN